MSALGRKQTVRYRPEADISDRHFLLLTPLNISYILYENILRIFMLTPNEERVLQFITRHIGLRGIGPTLGAILALAVSSGTVAQAGFLLLAYAAGLAVPFLAMGLAYDRVKPIYNRVRRYMGAVNYASGALIIIVGILIFTDSLINLNALFNFGLLAEVSSEV